MIGLIGISGWATEEVLVSPQWKVGNHGGRRNKSILGILEYAVLLLKFCCLCASLSISMGSSITWRSRWQIRVFWYAMDYNPSSFALRLSSVHYSNISAWIAGLWCFMVSNISGTFCNEGKTKLFRILCYKKILQDKLKIRVFFSACDIQRKWKYVYIFETWTLIVRCFQILPEKYGMLRNELGWDQTSLCCCFDTSKNDQPSVNNYRFKLTHPENHYYALIVFLICFSIYFRQYLLVDENSVRISNSCSVL